MIKMLRCGQCGSTKFIFTVGGSNGGHHGAICACCHKRLNIHDTRVGLSTFSNVMPTAKIEEQLNRVIKKQ
ncbi:hypothetical protein AAFN90_16025 [Erwiniaceae bacterium CAU 1747]